MTELFPTWLSVQDDIGEISFDSDAVDFFSSLLDFKAANVRLERYTSDQALPGESEMRGAGGMSGAIARQLNFQPLSTTHVLETATFFRVREGGDLYPMGFVSLEHRTFSKKNRHETTISYLLDDGRDTCQATAAWIYLSLQRFETTWAKTKSAGAYNCVVKVSVGDFGICDPLCRALASLDQRWNLTKGAERPSLAMVYRGKAVDFLAKAKSPRRRRPRFLGYKD